jgi:AraC-like DNA-binding protein
LERLNSDTKPDWADFAQEIGYFDQAHFVHDFREPVGCVPEKYLIPVQSIP